MPFRCSYQTSCLGTCVTYMQLSPHLVVDEEHHNYYPVVFFNEFWLLQGHLVPLNATVDS